jgi:hypothetical protein
MSVVDEEIAGGPSPVYDRMKGVSTIKSQNGEGQANVGSTRAIYLSSLHCAVL